MGRPCAGGRWTWSWWGAGTGPWLGGGTWEEVPEGCRWAGVGSSVPGTSGAAVTFVDVAKSHGREEDADNGTNRIPYGLRVDIEDAEVCVVLVGLLDEGGGVGVLEGAVGGRVALVTGGAFLVLSRPGRGGTVTTHS